MESSYGTFDTGRIANAWNQLSRQLSPSHRFLTIESDLYESWTPAEREDLSKLMA